MHYFSSIWLTFFPAKWAPDDTVPPRLRCARCQNPTPVPQYGGSHGFVPSYPKIFWWWQSFKEQQQRHCSICWICFCHPKPRKVLATAELSGLGKPQPELCMVVDIHSQDSEDILSQDVLSFHSMKVCQHRCQGCPLVACWLWRINNISKALASCLWMGHF